MEDNQIIKHLLELCDKALSTKWAEQGTVPRQRVSSELFSEIRSSGLSLLFRKYGKDHPMYSEFENALKDPSPLAIERAKGIFKSIKSELTA